MIRGLYTSAAGMLAGLRRYESVVQNLSNVRTIGYKADRTTLNDFPALLLARVRGDRADAEVGTVATGVSLSTVTTDLKAGELRLTDHPYDFAIVGDGYFRLETPEGVRYTRDGRFYRGQDGRLTSADGYPVLGTNGPIVLPPTDGTPFTVTPQGLIFVDDVPVAQLSVARFANPTDAVKVSQTNFKSAAAEPQLMPANEVRVFQGYLEESNVDVARETTELMSVMRAYESNQRLVQYQDQINRQTVSELGRV
jgi:flagellar basal-body rod protein FlgF